VTRLEQLWQDSIEQLKLSRRPENIVINVGSDCVILVDLSEHERMIANLSQLHQRILQIDAL
jgi:hypothetical protein